MELKNILVAALMTTFIGLVFVITGFAVPETMIVFVGCFFFSLGMLAVIWTIMVYEQDNKELKDLEQEIKSLKHNIYDFEHEKRYSIYDVHHELGEIKQKIEQLENKTKKTGGRK